MERLILRRTVAATLLATGGLALVGCGRDESLATHVLQQGQTSGPKVEIVYNTDGTREIRHPEIHVLDTIFERCDGQDLQEQTIPYGVPRSSSISRSVAHPACADGKLTPEDFGETP